MTTLATLPNTLATSQHVANTSRHAQSGLMHAHRSLLLLLACLLHRYTIQNHAWRRARGVLALERNIVDCFSYPFGGVGFGHFYWQTGGRHCC